MPVAAQSGLPGPVIWISISVGQKRRGLDQFMVKILDASGQHPTAETLIRERNLWRKIRYSSGIMSIASRSASSATGPV